MKIFKFISFIAFISIIVLLSGCKGKRTDTQIINDTYNNMTKQHNFVVKNTLEMKNGMQIQQQSQTVHVNMQSDTKGIMKFETNYSEAEAYIEVNNDTIYGYEHNGDNWSKVTLNQDLYSYIMSYQYLIDVLHNNSKIDKTGTDKLDDGTKVNIYTITFTDHDILREVVSLSADPNNIGITQEQLNNVTKNSVIKVYIDIDKNLVRKIEFNFLQTLNKINDLTNEEHYSKALITYTFDKFGKVSVSLPDEVVNLPFTTRD